MSQHGVSVSVRRDPRICAGTLNDRIQRWAAHRVGKEVVGADPCDKGVAEFGVVERDVVLDDPECLGPHELLEQLALLFLHVCEKTRMISSLLHCDSVLASLDRSEGNRTLKGQPSCRRPAPLAGGVGSHTLVPLCCTAWERATFPCAVLLSAIGCAWRDAGPAATRESVVQARDSVGP